MLGLMEKSLPHVQGLRGLCSRRVISCSCDRSAVSRVMLMKLRDARHTLPFTSISLLIIPCMIVYVTNKQEP